MPDKPRVIALEEHFWTPELRDTYTGFQAIKIKIATDRLDDLDELRLREMDEAGIDFQIISHVQPGVQIFEGPDAVALARRANDALYAAVQRHPTRFAGFATLPTPDPQGAADELERCVNELGFKGAMINGLTNGAFIDEQRFWGIFERAQALDVPIYLHPATPHPKVSEVYYKDYPLMVGAFWGFTAETALAILRLICSGVFDRFPKLRIIVGHLGETIPAALWRCDFIYERQRAKTGLKKRLAEYFREHFYITTSGNFSPPALVCAIMEMGVDHILFSVDWPFNTNTDAMEFMRTAPVSELDRRKILGLNVANVVRL